MGSVDKAQVPAYGQRDHIRRKPEAGERRWWREDRTNTADAAHELEHAQTTSSLCATVPPHPYLDEPEQQGRLDLVYGWPG
jgi:hypothetical protein